MGRKKTVPFIDKKNSSTFHLLHRSQRDVSEHVFYSSNAEEQQGGVEDGNGNNSNISSSGMVLWPSPHNSAETNRAVLLSDTNRDHRSASSINNTKNKNGGNVEGESSETLAASKNNMNRMMEWRLKLQQAGLLEKEEESAEKYVKEISGHGIFLHANGRVAANAGSTAVAGTAVNVEDTDVLELNKTLLDNIPLVEAIDDDIQELLFSEDVDFDEYEDLNDEFILDAAQEPKDDDNVDNATNSTADFDYDAHIQKLMDKARRERNLVGVAGDAAPNHHATGASDHAFFSKLQPLHEKQDGHDDDDDDDDSFANIPNHGDDQYSSSQQHMDTTTMCVVPALSPDEERALCEKFVQTLAEYDDDDDDDDDSDDDDGEYEYNDDAGDGEAESAAQGGGRGGLPLEGNPLVEAALDEFLIQHQHLDQDDNLMLPKTAAAQDAKKKTGGSGFSALMGKQMIRDCPWNNSGENPALDGREQGMESVQEVLALATSRLAEPIVKPPAEEILIDGKSYFSERHRNPWDCESILSTYSNLDNNPVTIDASTSRRRLQRQQKNKKALAQQPEEEEEAQIRLSSKTGLPLGVIRRGNHDDDSDDEDAKGDDTMISVNKGLARSKLESAEEKRTRKAAIKRERQVARLQKKVTRQVFQTELAKRTADASTANDTTAGKSVFRYS
jgi:protein LTV1